MEGDQARKYLSKLHVCKSMEPGGMHLQVLMNFANDTISEEWLICQRCVLPAKGTQTGWRDGHAGTSCSSTNGPGEELLRAVPSSTCWFFFRKGRGGHSGHQVVKVPAVCP